MSIQGILIQLREDGTWAIIRYADGMLVKLPSAATLIDALELERHAEMERIAYEGRPSFPAMRPLGQDPLNETLHAVGVTLPS